MRVLVLMTVLLAGCATTGPGGLPLTKVTLGEHTVRAEVAVTPDEQARGLMYRREMGKNDGMLFVYEQPRVLRFWMKNTFLPLDIAFIDSAGRIVHIAQMQPLNETSHSSVKPARFALEVHQGWMEEHGVQVGDSVSFKLPDGTAVP
jgi:uncharacterized membrane protein (UPF0127 family)